MHPQKFNNTLYEILRFNELLARVQFKCDLVVLIGKRNSGFNICMDPPFVQNGSKMGEALYISGSTYDDILFMKTLNPKRWVGFVPEGFETLDKLDDVDIELHYLLELKDSEDFTISEIVNEITNRNFDSAFINLYSPFISNPENGGVLKAKQLQIIIEIGSRNKENVIFSWYKLLYRFFFDFNYALIGAQSDGFCGRKIKSCKYRLSFVQSNLAEPPVFGFG
ncbi:unnamed protein product [Dracunculus medinensis]|uniref:Uncharacterized protein n=1 Tax=Dracunculus medinensis TaxID=318479 RepID=A0A3P7QSB7_DRAME|nr:unnamed protein product [Dracunculus medinensis]